MDVIPRGGGGVADSCLVSPDPQHEPDPAPASPKSPESTASDPSDQTPRTTSPDGSGASDRPEEPGLEALVGEWLTVPDLAEHLRVPLSAARRMIADRELLAAR